jgi:hypothetical protein
MMAENIEFVKDEEPISIEGGGETAPSSAVRAIGAAARGIGAAHSKSEFKRSLNLTGHGATRCRVFRTRIAGPALDFMENQINQWLDAEAIEIKHVGHIIGVMEGKTPEPNVIVMVWY